MDYLTGPRFDQDAGTFNLDGDDNLAHTAAALADLADLLLLRADERQHSTDETLVAVAGRLRKDAALLWDAVGRRLLSPVTTDHVKEADEPEGGAADATTADPPPPPKYPPAAKAVTATLNINGDVWTIRPLLGEAGDGFTMLLEAEREITFGPNPDEHGFYFIFAEAFGISLGNDELRQCGRSS